MRTPAALFLLGCGGDPQPSQQPGPAPTAPVDAAPAKPPADNDVIAKKDIVIARGIVGPWSVHDPDAVKAVELTLAGKPTSIEQALALTAKLYEQHVKPPQTGLAISWKASNLEAQRVPGEDGQPRTLLVAYKATVQDPADYDFAIDPNTTVDYGSLLYTCFGTVTNLSSAPHDVEVECQDKEHPKASPRPTRLHLAPHAKQKFSINYRPRDVALIKLVVTEAGKPVIAYNEYASTHGRDWIALAEKLRGTPFKLGELVLEHSAQSIPELVTTADWDKLAQPQRDAAAAAVWAGWEPHWKKFHEYPLGAIHLTAGTSKLDIADGKLKPARD